MKNTGLEEAQAGIRIVERNINNLRFVDDTTLMAESEEELKSLLMKVKEGSGKAGFKIQHSKNQDHGIWSHLFMQIDGEKVEAMRDFIFLCSKITADGDGSHEIKICSLLGRKAMTNLDSILKSRDISCLQRCIVKALVFPKVIYRWASWKIKKAECQRTGAFELWC